jgi:hypothetical protein
MLQFIHCFFTRHPKKWSPEALQGDLDLMRGMLEEAEAANKAEEDVGTVESQFEDRILELNHNDHELLKPLSIEQLDKVNLEFARQYFEDSFRFVVLQFCKSYVQFLHIYF